MHSNSNENVISLSFGKAQTVGAHDDPLQELLHEFDTPEAVEIAYVEADDIPLSTRPDFSFMSEEMLLEYVENKISSLKENTKRIRYYSSEIELHHDV